MCFITVMIIKIIIMIMINIMIIISRLTLKWLLV